MNLSLLRKLQEKPEPFVPGDACFWDDPYISEQLLSAHLDPNNDLASRRPEKIERSVDWLIQTLAVEAGTTLLDLGCGPGLYTSRFAKRGFHVTGVDFSRRSIDYAVRSGKKHNLEICYRYQNYLELEDTDQYDVALLIYGDFCPLSPDQRTQLLRNVYRALKPGGYFVLDVSTRVHRKRHETVNSWYVAENGFWRPGLHLVLEDGFDYPELSIYLDQYTIIEEGDKASVYRMWFQDHTPETITDELEKGGFSVKSIWGDLTGTLFSENAEWIGIIAQKSLWNKKG